MKKVDSIDVAARKIIFTYVVKIHSSTLAFCFRYFSMLRSASLDPWMEPMCKYLTDEIDLCQPLN